MPQAPEQNLNLKISANALPALGRASQLFLSLSLQVQGVVPIVGYDQIITELQRMRPFLGLFGKIAEHFHCKSPVEVLDLMARKEHGNMVLRMQALLYCTVTAHMLQLLLVHCLHTKPEKGSSEIKIDPKKLH